MATTTTPKGEADKRIGAYFAPLSVDAQDTPNMTVRIRAGSYFNTQNVFTEYAGGSTVAIPVPSTNARWTVVALTDAGTVALVHGTAAISPSLPAVPAGHLPLAGVYVTSTTTGLTSNMIIDLRPIVRATDTVANLDDQLADRPTNTDMNNALALKADVGGTPESEFVLNSDFTIGNPGTDAALVVMRGDADSVMIRWNESTDVWELTSDGTNFGTIATTAGVFAPVVHTHVAADTTDFAVAVAAEIAAADLDDLSNVNLTGQAVGHVLEYSGTEWVSVAHVHTKSDVSDFVEADYVHRTGAESIAGAKTFTGDVILGGPGTTVTVSADNLLIKDKVVILNNGEAGAGVGGGSPADAGITIDRGSLPDAVLQWNESTDTWQVGVIGNMDTVLTDSNLYNPQFQGVPVLPSYLVGALPAGVPGGMIYVSDATPNPAMAFFNGTSWIDVVTGVAVV